MKKNNTRKYIQVSIHLEPKTLENLKTMAEQSERSLSAQTRFYIDKGLRDEQQRSQK